MLMERRQAIVSGASEPTDDEIDESALEDLPEVIDTKVRDFFHRFATRCRPGGHPKLTTTTTTRHDHHHTHRHQHTAIMDIHSLSPQPIRLLARTPPEECLASGSWRCSSAWRSRWQVA